MTSRQEFCIFNNFPTDVDAVGQRPYLRTTGKALVHYLHQLSLTSGSERGRGSLCIILDSQTCSWETGWMRPLLSQTPVGLRSAPFFPLVPSFWSLTQNIPPQGRYGRQCGRRGTQRLRAQASKVQERGLCLLGSRWGHSKSIMRIHLNCVHLKNEFPTKGSSFPGSDEKKIMKKIKTCCYQFSSFTHLHTQNQNKVT